MDSRNNVILEKERNHCNEEHNRFICELEANWFVWLCVVVVLLILANFLVLIRCLKCLRKQLREILEDVWVWLAPQTPCRRAISRRRPVREKALVTRAQYVRRTAERSVPKVDDITVGSNQYNTPDVQMIENETLFSNKIKIVDEMYEEMMSSDRKLIQLHGGRMDVEGTDKQKKQTRSVTFSTIPEEAAESRREKRPPIVKSKQEAQTRSGSAVGTRQTQVGCDSTNKADVPPGQCLQKYYGPYLNQHFSLHL